MSAIIDEREIMPLLLAACPSFTNSWNEYIAGPLYEPGLFYLDVGEFAQHLVELLRAGDTAEFGEVFRVIEDLHVRGGTSTRQIAIIGLLESIQNIAGNRNVDPERFEPFLGEETRTWWGKLNRFWEGDTNALRQDPD